MKILILNWRSLKDPLSGGAEIATFEHAKRWVKNYGAEVTWLSPRYKGCPQEGQEIIEGVNFKYIGFPLTRNLISLFVAFPLFYIGVCSTYMTHYRNKINVVIDQVHGIPYLTPFYVKEKVVVYIHEVAGDIWGKMYKFPISFLGKLLEKIIFIPYRNKRILFVCVSQSTKEDLLKLGMLKENIEVIYNGVSLEPLREVPPKEPTFTMMFLNRLVKMKGIERALEVFSLVKKEIPQAKLWVVGRGEEDYINFLKEKCRHLDILDSVTFYGFVSEEEKIDLLKKAHVLLNTSYKEGWGLVNIEANTQGTPALGFDVEGVKESIENGVNGYVVADGDLEGMKNKALLVYNDLELQRSSLEYSKRFDWEGESNKFWEILKNG